MTPDAPPALYAPAPPVPGSLIEVTSDGKVTPHWDIIRQTARGPRPPSGADASAWTMARALMVAHGENPDAPPLNSCWGSVQTVPGYLNDNMSRPQGSMLFAPN